MQELFANRFLRARVLSSLPIVELSRTQEPYPGLSEVVSSLDEFLQATRLLGAVPHALLYDCRADSPPPAAIARAAARLEQALMRRFQPMAVVLSAAEAFARTDEGRDLRVHYFTNPDGARRALLHMTEEAKAISTTRGLGPGGICFRRAPADRRRIPG
jgi:hypothetical protein